MFHQSVHQKVLHDELEETREKVHRDQEHVQLHVVFVEELAVDEGQSGGDEQADDLVDEVPPAREVEVSAGDGAVGKDENAATVSFSVLGFWENKIDDVFFLNSCPWCGSVKNDKYVHQM